MSLLLDAAVLSRFDAREWGGVSIVTMGAPGPVVLTAYSAEGEGHFFDILHLLNGRGVEASEDLISLAAAGWVASGAAGTCTLYIDPATGHYAISTSAVDFSIPASAGNALLGFDAAGHALVGGGAPFVRVAPSAPVLAPLIDFKFSIDPAGAPLVFTVGADRWYQDPYTALRGRGTVADADDDNIADNLEALLQATYDNSIRVGLNADRAVTIAWNNTGAGAAPTWLSTSFRDALGFTGNEVTQTSGLVSWVDAERMCPRVLPLEEGIDKRPIGSRHMGTAGGLLSGEGTSNTFSKIQLTRAGFFLFGPSMGATRDASRHWLDRVRPAPGEPVTLYPAWGDPRRWRDPWEVTGTAIGTDVLANDLLHTTLEHGYRGRWRGYLVTEAMRDVWAEWEGEIRQRYKVTLELKAAP